VENEIETLQKAADTASEFIINYGFQFVGAIIILIIGWQIARWVGALVFKLCERTRLDTTLAKFFANVTKIVILVFVAIIALGKFGITIAPFIAALGAIAFGSTIALQGPLSNYGSGLTIILNRPFVVGDTVRVQGVTGIVDEIKLAYTELITEDGERITIPNNRIIGEVLVNSFANLIVEKKIAISYDDDPEQAVEVIINTLSRVPDVIDEPRPPGWDRRFR